MKTRTEKVLTVLKIVAWIAMIGYAMQCGSQLISVVVSFFNPEAASRFYEVNPDFFKLLPDSQGSFLYAMSIPIAVSASKVYIWILFIQLFSKLDLSLPFSMDTAKVLEKIAYQFLGIWIVILVGTFYLEWLGKRTGIEFGPTDFGGNEF